MGVQGMAKPLRQGITYYQYADGAEEPDNPLSGR